MSTIARTVATSQHRRPRRSVVRVVLFGAMLLLVVYANQPLRAYYHVLQGHRALSQHRYVEALAEFQVAQGIDPSNSDTGFWLARTCRKTGDLAGVRKYLSESRRLGYPDKKRLEREWWLVLAENGRVREVENHLAEMLMNPGDDGSEICDAFSKGYCLNLMFDPAQKLLDTWAADYPQDYRPYLRRAQIHAGRQQWALAIGELRQAVQRAPKEISVQRELGRCLSRNGERVEAEQQLLIVIEREPSDTASLMNLAQMAFDRNHLAKATDYLNTIVANQPRDFPARLLLAKVLLAKKDHAQAISLAQTLVEEWPEDLNAQFVLAQSFRTAGRAEEAKKHFVIHAELDKIWLRVESLTREINQRPTDPQLRYELGILLLRHISRQEGLAYLHSVFQFSPTHSETQQALAEYLEKMGEPAIAVRSQQFVGSHVSRFAAAGSTLPEDSPE